MYRLKIVISFLFLFSIQIFGQFSIDKFLDESFNQTLSSLKDSLSDKKFEEKETMSYKSIMYYDWLEPISIGVGFTFKKDGNIFAKMIGNGKEKAEDADKFFNIVKDILIKRYGPNYSENSMLGMTMIMWKGVDKFSLMLSKKGEVSKLMLIKK
jgi:hypothetical protein